MRQRADGSWELTTRKAPLAWSLVAAWSLAVVGVVLGGVVGWVSFVFFGVLGVILVCRLASTVVVATFTVDGVELGGRDGRGQVVAWPAVEALLLWTQAAAAEGRVDHLGVVTAADLPALGAGATWGDPADRAPVDLGHTLAVSTPLVDCHLDASELRSVLHALGSRALVVDRRR